MEKNSQISRIKITLDCWLTDTPEKVGFLFKGFKRIYIPPFLVIFLLTQSILATEWQPARPDYIWSFPKDHWAQQGYKTEWWYFTGHLSSEEGRRFGYQFTFFRVGLAPVPLDLNSNWMTGSLIMGHAAITDLTSNRHTFSDILYRAVPMLGGFGNYPDSLIAWSRPPAGTDKGWRLWWNGKGFGFEMSDRLQEFGFRLSTRPIKPLVFQGPNGYSRKGKGPTAASQYYSFTRMETKGTVTVKEEKIFVHGESWMDKEFGSNQLEEHQIGWDWFSLMLKDGREIMLYLIRDGSGRVDFARGTLVSSSGKLQYLGPESFSVQVKTKWKSSKTGAEYPARWMVEIPEEGLRMKVVPELADQENRSRAVVNLFYWEGLVEVIDTKDKKIGSGYVELVGYGTQSRPAI